MALATMTAQIDLREEVAPLLERIEMLEAKIGAIEEVMASETLAYSPKQVARLISRSTAYVHDLIESGELRAKTRGKNTAVLVRRSDLLDWLNGLPDYE